MSTKSEREYLHTSEICLFPQPPPCSKVRRGFSAFKVNTGKAHPNDIGNPPLTNVTNAPVSKRATGKDTLTNDQDQLWQGAVSVGTPLSSFTGKPIHLHTPLTAS